MDPSGALEGVVVGAAIGAQRVGYYFLTPFPLSLPFIGGYFMLSEMMPSEPSTLSLEARFGINTAASAVLVATGYGVFHAWPRQRAVES